VIFLYKFPLNPTGRC